MEDPGPVCMACADMDHLVFLARGDAALTRRARAASGLSAIVVRFSRARKRYERQGILVEPGALERAEAECLADEQARARRRECDTLRRAFSSAWRRRSCVCFQAARASARARERGSAGARERDRPPRRGTRQRARRAQRRRPRAAIRSDRARGPRLRAPPRHPLRRAPHVGRRPRERAHSTSATRSRARSTHGAPPRPPPTPSDRTPNRASGRRLRHFNDA